MFLPGAPRAHSMRWAVVWQVLAGGQQVTSMLIKYWQHVTCIWPAFCLHIISMLPVYGHYIASLLTVCWHYVDNMLIACWQHVVDMLSVCYLLTAKILIAYSQHVTSIWLHIECYLQTFFKHMAYMFQFVATPAQQEEKVWRKRAEANARSRASMLNKNQQD